MKLSKLIEDLSDLYDTYHDCDVIISISIKNLNSDALEELKLDKKLKEAVFSYRENRVKLLFEDF